MQAIWRPRGALQYTWRGGLTYFFGLKISVMYFFCVCYMKLRRTPRHVYCKYAIPPPPPKSGRLNQVALCFKFFMTSTAPSKMFFQAFFAKSVATSRLNRLLKRQLTNQTLEIFLNDIHEVLVITRRQTIFCSFRHHRKIRKWKLWKKQEYQENSESRNARMPEIKTRSPKTRNCYPGPHKKQNVPLFG